VRPSMLGQHGPDYACQPGRLHLSLKRMMYGTRREPGENASWPNVAHEMFFGVLQPTPAVIYVVHRHQCGPYPLVNYVSSRPAAAAASSINFEAK
jgi:hypothetical protein